MQAQLASTQARLDHWQSTFAPVAQDASIPLEPEAILAELRQKREAQPSAAAAGPVSSASGDLLAARQREESLQVSVWLEWCRCQAEERAHSICTCQLEARGGHEQWQQKEGSQVSGGARTALIISRRRRCADKSFKQASTGAAAAAAQGGL